MRHIVIGNPAIRARAVGIDHIDSVEVREIRIPINAAAERIVGPGQRCAAAPREGVPIEIVECKRAVLRGEIVGAGKAAGY